MTVEVVLFFTVVVVTGSGGRVVVVVGVTTGGGTAPGVVVDVTEPGRVGDTGVVGMVIEGVVVVEARAAGGHGNSP